MQVWHLRLIPETHPGPPCREGGKDKETLSNLPIERVEVGLLAFLFRLPQAAFVLSSLPTGRVGVGLWGPGWVSCGSPGWVRNACQIIYWFSPSVLAIFATVCPLGCKYAILGDVSNTLTINRLNFTDTMMGPKTGLKRPKRACETATVARRLWPFRRLRAALLQVRCAFPQVRCGSFTNSKRRNGKTDGLLRWFKTGFPLRLEDFGGCVFVHIIRHHPMACRDSLRRAYGCVGHARTRFPPAVNCPHSPILRVAASRLSPHIRCGLEGGEPSHLLFMNILQSRLKDRTRQDSDLFPTP